MFFCIGIFLRPFRCHHIYKGIALIHHIGTDRTRLSCANDNLQIRALIKRSICDTFYRFWNYHFFYCRILHKGALINRCNIFRDGHHFLTSLIPQQNALRNNKIIIRCRIFFRIKRVNRKCSLRTIFWYCANTDIRNPGRDLLRRHDLSGNL